MSSSDLPDDSKLPSTSATATEASKFKKSETTASSSLPSSLLATFHCPFQLPNSTVCWTTLMPYQVQEDISTIDRETSRKCPFGHQAEENTDTTTTPTENTNKDDQESKSNRKELISLSPYICVDYLRGECSLKTVTLESLSKNEKDLQKPKPPSLIRCLHGFHPSAHQLQDQEYSAYQLAIATFYKDNNQETTNQTNVPPPTCTQCSRPMSTYMSHYPFPSECRHLFCHSCSSLWQPYTDDEACPLCTHHPQPRLIAHSVRSRASLSQVEVVHSASEEQVKAANSIVGPQNSLTIKQSEPPSLNTSHSRETTTTNTSSSSSSLPKVVSKLHQHQDPHHHHRHRRNLKGRPLEEEVSMEQWCCVLLLVIGGTVLIFSLLHLYRQLKIGPYLLSRRRSSTTDSPR